MTPNEKNVQSHRTARSNFKQTIPRCSIEYWILLSEDIQTAAITGNWCTMISESYLDQLKLESPPLKSSTGGSNRWHQPTDGWNIILTITRNRTLFLPQPSMPLNAGQPWMHWTLGELSKAIDSLAAAKAAGIGWNTTWTDQALQDNGTDHITWSPANAGKNVRYH